MVSNVIEAPAPKAPQGGAKADDQKSQGVDFMALMLGMVQAQTANPGQSVTPQIPQQAQATASAQAASATAAAVVTADTSGKADALTQVIQAGATAQAEAAAKPVADGSKQLKAMQKQSAQPDASQKQPVQPETNPADTTVIKALKDMTAKQDSPVALPEAARPDGEIAAQIVAMRAAGAGQNARLGEVLPQTGIPQTTGKAETDNAARTTAAHAVGANHKSAPTSSDAVRPGQAANAATGPIVATAATGGNTGDSLGFDNHASKQPVTSASEPKIEAPQSFGAEMKAQVTADPLTHQVQDVRQAVDTQPAQPAQADPAAARIQADPTIGDSVVHQIVRDVSLHRSGENTTLSIRLDPPELGTIKVNVTSQSGVLTTQIESPSSSVRTLLETHIPALRDALTSAGIDCKNFSVSAGLDFGQNGERQQQAWQPSRFAPAVGFNSNTQDQQASETAYGSALTVAAGNSWLA